MRILSVYSSLLAIHHIIFALPFAIVGFLMALQDGYAFNNTLFLLVLFCMFFARNAAMAFNRYADAVIDSKNKRTKNRPIQQGLISRKSVLRFTFLNSILFVVSAYLITPLCFFLSFIALSITLGYSYAKRVTSLSHFILGAGLGLAPMGSYIAVSNQFSILPFLLSMAVMFWVAGFDILYALQDEAFDRKERLFSIPSVWGAKNAIHIARICHILSIAFIIKVGTMLPHTAIIIYWIGSITFALLILWQHLKVGIDKLYLLNKQFFVFNGWASVLFCLTFCLYYIKN